LILCLFFADCVGEVESSSCLGCADAPARAIPGQTGPRDPPSAAIRPAAHTCRAVAPPAFLVEAHRAFLALPEMKEPVAVMRPRVGKYWYAIERLGRVLRFEDHPDSSQLTEVLDLTNEVDPQGDAGLVAAAFHPGFAGGGRLFLSYTALGGTVMRSRVISLASSDDGAHFDPATRKVIFDFDQTNPWRIHLNADLQFGPDGYLYAGFGDGSPMGDPEHHGQDLRDYRGKILRVDVDHGEPYQIPATNPFTEEEGMPEVYALGLRNPWRFSFDASSGELWAGDVGVYTWEEVDQIPAGGNLGWNIREANHCLAGTTCQTAGLVAPVVEYAHDGQASAVVGGYVYHGKAIPALVGRYVFGDYSRGDIWALDAANKPELIARTGRRITSFAQEPNGELLIVDTASGEILRLEPAPPASDLVADRLSQTGCLLASDPTQPAAGLVPYDVRIPFWSDSAAKRRFLSVPDGERATVRADGRLVLPVGSVLVKQFFLADRPIETRLLMKYRDSQWAGYSYVWDGDGREAHLAPEAELTVRQWDGLTWSYPTRGNCLGCHNQDRGLGLEVGQLDFTTGDGTNSLARLQQQGLLDGDLPAVPRLPDLAGPASVEERARAYLHVNCSICHFPGGPTPVDMNLDFATPFAAARVCDVAPVDGDLGVDGAQRLAPGAPERSMLSLRMHAIGRQHMPPIGPRLVDEAGAALIDGWIRGLRGCP
jgi:uncharacterized repeat protein (TIGR03806 family)